MRKLCWWACACSAAIFASVYLLPEALLLPAGLLCALGGLFSRALHGSARPRAALLAAGLAVGFLWTGLYTALVRGPAHALSTQEALEYRFTVTSFPTATSRGASLTVSLPLEGRPDASVQLYADADALELRPGCQAAAQLTLSPSDFLRGESVEFYQAKGVYLLGYARGALRDITQPDGIPPWFWPQYAAKALKDSVARVFPSDVSGFITALLTGDKSTLPAGLYTAFQRAGLSHVVAVSGLHIGFLAAMMALFLGRRSRRGALLTLLCVFFFAALAGNSPSALRAAFMCAFPLLAPLLGREEDRPTALCAALALLLIQCPYAAASISLQLSFAAVAGIYLVTSPLYEKWRAILPRWDKPPLALLERLGRFCASSFSVTLGALLFTTPLAALYFHTLSLAGPLSNLLTLWAVSLVFLGGLLSALLGLLFPGPAAILAGIVAWPARWVIFVARGISRLAFSAVPLSSVYLLGWFCMAYAVALLILFSHGRIRPAVWVTAALPTLCAALLANAWPVLTGSLTVTALDVGQGASTLFYSKGHSVLVDCGGNGWDDPGDVAADHLQAMGSSRLDALILTHYHSDHACGVAELLERLDVSLILAPDVEPDSPLRQELLSLAQAHGCPVTLLSEDASLTFGDARLRIYEPLGKGGSNEEGLSVLCSVGSFDALVTGDMGGDVEERLVKYKDLPDIELLLVGHHGAKNSTSPALLRATLPDSAVISSGYNSYGHPAPETMERLWAVGCDVYRTDLMGTVRFIIQKEGSEP